MFDAPVVEEFVWVERLRGKVDLGAGWEKEWILWPKDFDGQVGLYVLGWYTGLLRTEGGGFFVCVDWMSEIWLALPTGQGLIDVSAGWWSLEVGIMFLEREEVGWAITTVEELFGVWWLDLKVKSKEDWGLGSAFWDGSLVWERCPVNLEVLSKGFVAIVGAALKAVKQDKGSAGI
jgi:hypothetical protein